MTIIAIWEEDGDIWCVADTRISNRSSNNGLNILTDTACKIHSLPVRVLSFGDTPKSFIPIFSTTLGFSVAGSALAAAQTAGVVSTLLQQLTTPSDQQLPTLADISDLILPILKEYAKDIGSATNGNVGDCEAALFGQCPKREKLETFHIVASPRTEKYSSERIDNKEYPLLLGSGQRIFQEKYASYEDEFINRRVPRRIIDQMVEENHDDVGGNISIGICGKSGFRLFWNLQPIEKGKPDAKRLFNGIELTRDLAQVGPCFIGGFGMA